MKHFFLKYKKPIVITTSITILQIIWGFDPKFCIINIVWLLVLTIKYENEKSFSTMHWK
jgi:hypothetical protein